MPKTNKTTRKASSASTKKSGLMRRFDLTNKKVQFFVVIAIVAVLGGGWFTYRSFASSVVTGITAAQLNSIPANRKVTEKVSGTNAPGLTDKKNTVVGRIGPNSAGGSNIWNPKIDLRSDRNYRFCIWTRYERPTASSRPANIVMRGYYAVGSPNSGNFQQVTLANNNRVVKTYTSYNKQCTTSFKGRGYWTYFFKVENNGPSTIRVGSFFIENI